MGVKLRRRPLIALLMSLGEFISAIEDGTLIGAVGLTLSGVDRVLEQRDLDEFSHSWMSAFRRVEAQGEHASQGVILHLRESAYLQAFRRWHSPDLAGCISDDVGLIGASLSLDPADEWVTGLLECYLRGQLPTCTAW